MIYRLRDIFNVQPDKFYCVLWMYTQFELHCLQRYEKIWHRNEFTVVLHHFSFYQFSVSICRERTRTGEVLKLEFCPIFAWCTTPVAQLSQIIFWVTHFYWGTSEVSLQNWNVFTKIYEVDKIKRLIYWIGSFFIRIILRRAFLNMGLVHHSPSSAVKIFISEYRHLRLV